MRDLSNDMLRMAKDLVARSFIARDSDIVAEVELALKAAKAGYENIYLDASNESIIISKKKIVLYKVVSVQSKPSRSEAKNIAKDWFRSSKAILGKIKKVASILLEDDGIKVRAPRLEGDIKIKEYRGGTYGITIYTSMAIEIDEVVPDIPSSLYKVGNVILVPRKSFGLSYGYYLIDELTFDENRWKWVASLSLLSIAGKTESGRAAIVINNRKVFAYKSVADMKRGMAVREGALNKLKNELEKVVNEAVEMSASWEESGMPLLGDFRFTYGNSRASMIDLVGNIIDDKFAIYKYYRHGSSVVSGSISSMSPATTAKKAAKLLMDSWANTLSGAPDAGRLKSPQVDDLENFVKGISRWFEVERRGKGLSLTTRENGSVGEEEYGQDDYDLAWEIRKQVLKKFGDSVSVSVEPVDEWVSIEIDLK